MRKGTSTSDWNFYLKDIYIHFNNSEGKDIALSRCRLKLRTQNFFDPKNSLSYSDRKALGNRKKI